MFLHLRPLRERTATEFSNKYKHVPAPVAELVDALDSKSSSFGSGGSIPPGGTTFQVKTAYN